MKIKLSDLEIDHIDFLSSIIHFTPGNETDLKKFFSTDNIDIDFETLTHKENKQQFKIILTAQINSNVSKKKPGYSILVSLQGVFRILKNVEEVEYANFKLKSALPMMISYLRAHIADVTSKFPLGSYLLPSIDLSELILEKGNASSKTDVKKKLKSE